MFDSELGLQVTSGPTKSGCAPAGRLLSGSSRSKNNNCESCTYISIVVATVATEQRAVSGRTLQNWGTDARKQLRAVCIPPPLPPHHRA